jgi:hypothetical protein
MKVICAWCKKDLGDKEPLEEKTISHSICENCYSSIIDSIPSMPLSKDMHTLEGLDLGSHGELFW